MTWLRQPSGRDLDWDGVTAIFPGAADSVTWLHRVIWEQGDPVLLEQSQSVTFALSAVNDPVLTEMVRLRNARFQHCHFCQSRRSPAARALGATEALYAAIDDYEAGDLSERQKAALRLADAYLLWPAGTPQDVRAGAREHFTTEQIVEFILRLMAYSSDKVMISLNLDLDEPLIE